jgi:PLP dependent protein
VIETGRNVAENLARVHERIAAAAARAGRRSDEITVVGVSKTQAPEAIVEAVRAGVRHIGENRVQEAAAKIPTVRTLLGAHSVLSPQSSVLLHMVGHLQSNKAGDAVALFDRVDSVDSLKVAEALSRRVHPGHHLPVLLEVYVGDDPRRPGIRPDQLVETTRQILAVPWLRVEGLMTVAPLGGDARAAFRQVRELKQDLSESFPRVHFGVLSMGMSEDYPLAIEEGSTEIRIGTALFGPRKPRF